MALLLEILSVVGGDHYVSDQLRLARFNLERGLRN
jgi:hypothetical protein